MGSECPICSLFDPIDLRDEHRCGGKRLIWGADEAILGKKLLSTRLCAVDCSFILVFYW